MTLSQSKVTQAMILAAGRGERFRPFTDTRPKPLIPVQGKPLIDWQLERLHRQGFTRIVINSCYMADMLEAHVSRWSDTLDIIISREETALETGGGIRHALPHFQGNPFYVINADVLFWPMNDAAPFAALHNALQENPHLSAVLLLQPSTNVKGLTSNGDFHCNTDGYLKRRVKEYSAPYLFTGIQLLQPDAFEETKQSAFSMNVVYDTLMQQSRIAGVINANGTMLHVGDPQGYVEVETWLDSHTVETTKHQNLHTA